jgi:hypothetical protein
MGKDVTDALAEIAGRILVVREQRVMLDADLAQLYGVSTKAFNQAVRRNRGRFPGDFLLELTKQEVARSRSQSVTLKSGRGYNVKYLPMAFTEHGAIMAATMIFGACVPSDLHSRYCFSGDACRSSHCALQPARRMPPRRHHRERP